MRSYSDIVVKTIARQTDRRGLLASAVRGAVTLGLAACFAIGGEETSMAAARDCTAIEAPCGRSACGRDEARYEGNSVCLKETDAPICTGCPDPRKTLRPCPKDFEIDTFWKCCCGKTRDREGAIKWCFTCTRERTICKCPVALGEKC